MCKGNDFESSIEHPEDFVAIEIEQIDVPTYLRIRCDIAEAQVSVSLGQVQQVRQYPGPVA